MAFDFSSCKRVARIFLIGLTLGIVATPVLAAQASPLQYQSRNFNGADNGDGNPCDARSGHRRDGQGMSAYCDAQPKYSQHGNDNARHPGASAFGLQFDTEGY